jgi:transcriptional regulator with XRE-family HTH domain
LNTFGERLKKLRNDKQLTGEELGKILNVTKVAVSNWESGNRTPDADMLIKLADFFDVSLDYLLGRTDDPNTVILTNKKRDLPENLKGLGLDENIP